MTAYILSVRLPRKRGPGALASRRNGMRGRRCDGSGASFHLQIELANQRAPLRLLAVDVLRVALRGRDQGVASFGQNALLDLIAPKERAQRGIESIDDRPRRSRRREQPIMKDRFESGQARLACGRHVGQEAEARGTEHRDRSGRMTGTVERQRDGSVQYRDAMGRMTGSPRHHGGEQA